MSAENPTQYTPEQMAELEKSRAISDGGLLEEGAEYTFNEKGERALIATQEQKDSIDSRHSYNAIRGLSEEETKEKRMAAMTLFLEKLGSIIKIDSSELGSFRPLMSHLYQKRDSHEVGIKSLDSLNPDEVGKLNSLKMAIEESEIHKFISDGIDCRMCFISAIEEVDPKMAMKIAKGENDRW